MKDLRNFFYSLEDIYYDLRFKHRKAKQRQARFEQSLSPAKLKRYRKNKLRRRLYTGCATALVLGLCILLPVTANRRPRKSSGRHQEPRQERQNTETAIQPQAQKLYPEKDITIGSTGCMLLHSPFISSYPDAEGNYDFSSIYRYITPYYSEPDFMTCEFEGALGGEELGYHGYPAFRSPDAIIQNIHDSGVDLQMLATNHIYDGSSYGFHRTMDVYDEKQIAYTGIRKSVEEKPYYIADVDGVRIGFVDYVYETKGTGTNINGIPMDSQDADLINSFKYDDLDSFYREADETIRLMKQDGAQFIVANLHWGTEYQLTESDIQREMAQKLCDLGIDALIGGHPHCEQPIDVFENADKTHAMFCIFSVGNALSNQRTYLMDEMPTGHTEDGVMVTLALHQNTDGQVTITDVDLLPTWVYRFQNNGSKYYILPLDDVSSLEAKTGISGICSDAQASYDRTMAELGPGFEKARTFFRQSQNS